MVIYGVKCPWCGPSIQECHGYIKGMLITCDGCDCGVEYVRFDNMSELQENLNRLVKAKYWKCPNGHIYPEGYDYNLVCCPECQEVLNTKPMTYVELQNDKNWQLLRKAQDKAAKADQALVDIMQSWDDEQYVAERLENYFDYEPDKYPWYDGPTQEMVDFCVSEAGTFHDDTDGHKMLHKIADILQNLIDGESLDSKA